jgi:regulator of protease activity HflC (stomatin/prohibitin superfamily)
MIYAAICLLMAGIAGACLLSAKRKDASAPAILGGALAALALVTLAFSWTPIPSAKVGVVTVFGKVQPGVLGEGQNWTAPWARVVECDLTLGLIDIQSTDAANAVVAVTKDRVGLPTLSVGFLYQPNALLQAKLYERFRGNLLRTVLEPAAHNAIREATAQMTWEEAVVDKRDVLIQRMQEEFAKFVTESLVSAGLTREEAKAAFTFPAVQLRSVLPPKRILDANAELQAASIDLQRQAILTQIAGQVAERQRNQGTGIKNMFEQLPAGYASEDVYRVMSAVALKEQADALTRAVEEGKIQMMVVPYQGAVASMLPEMPAARPAARQ